MLLFLVIRSDFFHGAYLCCGGSASRRKAHGEGLSLASSLHWGRCTTTFLTMETIWQNQPVVIRHVWCRDLLILCCWIRCLILRYLVQLCQLTLWEGCFSTCCQQILQGLYVSQASTKGGDTKQFCNACIQHWCKFIRKLVCPLETCKRRDVESHGYWLNMIAFGLSAHSPWREWELSDFNGRRPLTP